MKVELLCPRPCALTRAMVELEPDELPHVGDMVQAAHPWDCGYVVGQRVWVMTEHPDGEPRVAFVRLLPVTPEGMPVSQIARRHARAG